MSDVEIILLSSVVSLFLFGFVKLIISANKEFPRKSGNEDEQERFESSIW